MANRISSSVAFDAVDTVSALCESPMTSLPPLSRLIFSDGDLTMSRLRPTKIGEHKRNETETLLPMRADKRVYGVYVHECLH